MPDDETVNQMIARHEEEFDLFMVSAADTGFPTCTDRGPWGSHAPPCRHPADRVVSVTLASPALLGSRDSPSRGLQTAPN